MFETNQIGQPTYLPFSLEPINFCGQLLNLTSINTQKPLKIFLNALFNRKKIKRSHQLNMILVWHVITAYLGMKIVLCSNWHFRAGYDSN